MNEAIRMQLSAFVDGELPENEAELLLLRMCQDAALRREVGEFLAIGRLMRAEPGLAGADRLHERVAARLGDVVPPAVESPAGASKSSRPLRPIAGAALAAAVALVALFVLQQKAVVDETESLAPVTVADGLDGVDGVPQYDVQQERQRQYFLNHTETSSELGANGVNSRVVSLRFSQQLADESGEDPAEEDKDDDPAEEDKYDDAQTETVIQP